MDYRCCVCKEIKSEDQFYVDRTTKKQRKVQSACILCCKKRNAEYEKTYERRISPEAI